MSFYEVSYSKVNTPPITVTVQTSKDKKEIENYFRQNKGATMIWGIVETKDVSTEYELIVI